VAQQQTGDLRHARTGIELRPGLDGVPATQSAICDIDGEKGLLTYRGYPMQDLAANSSFLETAYLLIWGELPSRDQLAEFEHAVQMHRRVSFRVRDMMKCFPASGHPMDALQSSAASLGLFYSRRAIDDPQYIYDAVVRLIAKIPTMVAAFQLIRKGQDPIQPRDDLAYSANFLYMLTEREPDPLAARIFDRCLMLHAEHSLNASTFSARVTASTLTDPYAVVASAVGTLAGPLHGGANEDVLAMLEQVGSPENAGAFLDEAIAAKRKIMGFGHREYKVKDPRAVILQALVEEMFASFGHDTSTTWPGRSKQKQRPASAPKASIPTSIFIRDLCTASSVFPGICSRRSSPLPGLPAGWPIGGSSSGRTGFSGLRRSTPDPSHAPGCPLRSASRLRPPKLHPLPSTPW